MSVLQKTALLLLVGVLLAAAGIVLYLDRASSPPSERLAMNVDSTACRDGIAPCTASHPVLGELQLHFPGGAYYMRGFMAELRLGDPGAIEAATLELTMSGMDMGRNRFSLQRTDDGVWRGELLLPICVTGRVDWQVKVLLVTNDGQGYSAVFPLQLKQPSKRD